MSLRTIILLIVALGSAAATALYARNWAAMQQAQVKESTPRLIAAPAPKPQPMVLVAARNLPIGAFVRNELLTWQPWPEDGVNDAYVSRDPDEEVNMPFDGAVVRRPLTKGQPVTQNMLVHPGERGFLAAVLTPGNRAVSVPVNKTTGISGFVFPGDRVDLVLSLRLKGEDEEGKGQTRYASLTLLEGVRVLAIDQAVDNAEGDAMPAKTATLEVTPLQAEKIALSLQMGSLSLSLTSLQKKEQNQIVGNGTERLQTVSLRDDAKPIDAPNADARGRNFTLDIEVFTVNGKDMTLKFPQRSKRRAGRESVTVLRGSESAKAKF